MTRRRIAAGAVALALVAAGCAGVSPPARIRVPEGARTVERHILYESTTWRGDVRVVRPVIVTRNATLTVLPGTRVFFDLPDPRPGERRDPWIRILGTLVALGTEEQPILFTSVPLRNNELDNMVDLDRAKEAHFRYCTFERGPWGVHAHETPVEFERCTFRGNYGGLRFQGGRVVVRRCRFEGNRIGIRCLNASPVIEENEFLDNLTAVFFRQGVRGAVVRRNNFASREYDIKLGEAQTEDVEARENWWRAAARGRLSEVIFDGADSQGVGRVVVDPVLPQPWGRPGKGR